jgi:frataxin-like iron-binding protein CyaY
MSQDVMDRYIGIAVDMIEQAYIENGSECDAMDLTFDYILAMVFNTKHAMTIIWHASEQLGMNLV